MKKQVEQANQFSSRITGEGTVVTDELVTRQVIVDREEEILKLNIIADCGSEHGFTAPRAWGNADRARISMNHVATSLSSQDVFRNHVCGEQPGGDQCIQMASEAGRVLAAIHRALEAHFPETDSKSKSTGQSQTVLHCDFGFSNIYLGPDSQLVVFDPFPEFYTTFETWQVGRASLDLGMFASCLIGRLSLRDYLSLKPDRIPKILRQFVDAYNIHSQRTIGLPDVVKDAVFVAESYFASPNHRFLKRRFGMGLWSRNLRVVEKALF